MGNTPTVGGSEHFEVFYRREFRSVLGLAVVLSGSVSAAEELTQEAFVTVLRRWDHVSALDNPSAWVRAVVANRSVSRFRRTVAEGRAMLGLRYASSDAPSLEVEARLDVWREVRRLPRRQAQVIALTYLDDLTRAEVAEVLSCSEETVKTHLARGRAALADRLSTWRESNGAD